MPKNVRKRPKMLENVRKRPKMFETSETSENVRRGSSEGHAAPFFGEPPPNSYYLGRVVTFWEVPRQYRCSQLIHESMGRAVAGPR